MTSAVAKKQREASKPNAAQLDKKCRRASRRRRECVRIRCRESRTDRPKPKTGPSQLTVAVAPCVDVDVEVFKLLGLGPAAKGLTGMPLLLLPGPSSKWRQSGFRSLVP